MAISAAFAPAPAARPVVVALPGRHKRAQAGHPWLYSNEIRMDAAAKALPPGALVRLVAADGAALGAAFFNPHSLLAARLLDRDADAAIDAKWLAARLEAALALRTRLFDRPFYRLVHAEADALPGLVIDRFGDALVVQANAAGMELLEPALLAALDRVLAPRAVVLRNDGAVRALEGLKTETRVAKGGIDGPLDLVENGAAFFADALGGQKTGWYYDQRDNRAFMAGAAKGARVLDLYCHTGGFAVQALAAGAREALGIDSSAPALVLAERAARANGVSERCAFRRADVFEEAERLAAAGARFDAVIADPPAFVKSKKDVPAGAKGYRKLAKLAARLVAPGGLLLLASCSHNMEAGRFAEEARRGLGEAGRAGRIVRQAGAGPDHPVHPHLPESAYLKAIVYALD